jgi:hypothetical protein
MSVSVWSMVAMNHYGVRFGHGPLAKPTMDWIPRTLCNTTLNRLHTLNISRGYLINSSKTIYNTVWQRNSAAPLVVWRVLLRQTIWWSANKVTSTQRLVTSTDMANTMTFLETERTPIHSSRRRHLVKFILYWTLLSLGRVRDGTSRQLLLCPYINRNPTQP